MGISKEVCIGVYEEVCIGEVWVMNFDGCIPPQCVEVWCEFGLITPYLKEVPKELLV